MANNSQYRFSRENDDGYVIFDSKGYVVEAKGFGSLMWSSTNIDKDLVGKHVDEVAEMLKKDGSTYNAYLEFEAHVHVGLLKKMLQNANH